MAWTVDWQVFVDGEDMTAAMRPYLIDIETVDKDGSASDTCALTLDDSDGQIKLPKDGAAVRALLNGVQVFDGTVDDVRSSGSRGGGRLIKVKAKGFDSRGKAKEPQQFHLDDASLKAFLEKAAGKAGFSVEVDEDLASIRRDYWAAEGESFLHLGQRLARELHATFKLRGKKAVLAARGKDKGLPVITGTVGPGGNVINWDIAPFSGRRSFTRARVSYFDRKAAEFKSEEVEFSLDRELPESVNTVRTTAGDKDQAKSIGEARKSEAEREGGSGSVTLDLVPQAQAEAEFILIGARPGVDGTYRIVTVKHKASRSGGSTTSLELKQPQGGAGKDERKSKGGTGAGQSGTTSGAASGASAGGAGTASASGSGGATLDTPGDGPE